MNASHFPMMPRQGFAPSSPQSDLVRYSISSGSDSGYSPATAKPPTHIRLPSIQALLGETGAFPPSSRTSSSSSPTSPALHLPSPIVLPSPQQTSPLTQSQPFVLAPNRMSIVSPSSSPISPYHYQSSPYYSSISPKPSKRSPQQPRKRRANLPKKTTGILLDWLNNNLEHPYPNAAEKADLIRQTGLTNQQLSNWFINARRRKISILRSQRRSQ